MKKLLKWIPSILIMGVLFYLSSRQGTPLAPTYFWNYLANKAAHFFWYFMLMLSFYYATGNILLAVMLATLYGVSDELHQLFVPTRTGSVKDVAIDWVAASFGGVVIYAINILKKGKEWK